MDNIDSEDENMDVNKSFLENSSSAELAGQSIPTNQGQSIPTCSGHSMPERILQAMLQQQSLLLKTVQALNTNVSESKSDNELTNKSDNELTNKCGNEPTNKSGNEPTNKSGNEPTPVESDDSRVNAPLSYDLDEVSSDDERDCASDSEDLLTMQKLYDNSDNFSDKVHDKLADNINLSLRKRLSKKDQRDILDQYKRPENVDNMSVPKVNIELWEDANQNMKNKDMNLSKIQALILTACASVTEIVQKCLTKNKDGITTKECTKALVSLSAAFTELTQVRRESFKSGMNHDYKSRLCSTDNEPSTKWIFGDDLGKKIKDIHDTKSISSKLVMRRDKGFEKLRHHPFSKKGKQPISRKPFLGKRRFQKSKYKNVEDEWK